MCSKSQEKKIYIMEKSIFHLFQKVNKNKTEQCFFNECIYIYVWGDFFFADPNVIDKNTSMCKTKRILN